MRDWRGLSLRVRLTLWYVLLLALTLVVFGEYVHVRLEQSVLAQTDMGLQAAVSEVETDPDGRVFGGNGDGGERIERLTGAGFTARIVAADGTVRDSFGNITATPFPFPITAGLLNASQGEMHWRILSRELYGANGERVGWLQVAQSLNPLQTVLETLLTQTLLGLPLALALAGIGGLVLSGRALRPIERVTQTAQAVSASDLTRRINYRGPTDEVGRLAVTFDRMLDRLHMAFERERRFTADASHELRTPLTAIKGRIGVTLSRPRTATEYAHALADVEGEVNRLIRLSGDLLYLSRLDQGEPRLPLRMMDLGDLLDTITEQMEPLARTRNLTLHAQVAPGLAVRGDLDHLTRLFLNLLGNALKYTPSGGTITVRAEKHAREVLVAVSDTGPGIAPEHLPHLFERFYRVEADRSRQTGGTGLGLAIAREIAHWHGGTLTVASTQGDGTTFTVRVPSHDAHATAELPLRGPGTAKISGRA